MGGCVLQIVSKGQHDELITNCPEITFFQAVYKRHTRFAIETNEIMPTGNVGFGSRIKIPITKLGDLLSNISLRVKLPALKQPVSDENSFSTTKLSWINGIGHALIEKIEFTINNVVMDSFNGEWLHINSSFCYPNSKLESYKKMVSYEYDVNRTTQTTFSYNNTGEMEMIIPLPFWFCKSISQAIPLLCMPFVEFGVNINIRNLEDLVVQNNYDVTYPIQFDTNTSRCPLDITILADYVYLNQNERMTISQQEHAFLIEQVQEYRRDGISNSSNILYIDLPFMYPVKEFFWLVQRDYTRQKNINKDLFYYGIYSFNEEDQIIEPEYFESPIVSTKMTLNQQVRFNKMPSIYFEKYQPFKYHTRVPDQHISMFSFALKPEDIQPSGSCNYSIVENPQLVIELNNKDKSFVPGTLSFRSYARSYNVLQIKDGQANLIYVV